MYISNIQSQTKYFNWLLRKTNTCVNLNSPCFICHIFSFFIYLFFIFLQLSGIDRIFKPSFTSHHYSPTGITGGDFSFPLPLSVCLSVHFSFPHFFCMLLKNDMKLVKQFQNVKTTDQLYTFVASGGHIFEKIIFDIPIF